MNPDYNTLLRFYRAMTGANSSHNAGAVVNPAQNPNQNILPPQTVTQVNGKASIDMLRMSPDSSVLLMDAHEPIVWLCTSDGLGNVTSVAYDISPHKDAPPVNVNRLEDRIARIETVLTNLFGGVENGKSNDGATEHGKDAVTAGESVAN